MDTAIRILNSTRKIPISHCLYPINLRSLSRTVTSMENRLLDFQICLEEGLFFKDSEILSRAEEAANEGWRSASPVSYTHLRAHETRHDLVCRLLLEKK